MKLTFEECPCGNIRIEGEDCSLNFTNPYWIGCWDRNSSPPWKKNKQSGTVKCLAEGCSNLVEKQRIDALYCSERCGHKVRMARRVPEITRARALERAALQRGAGVSRLITQEEVWEKSEGNCWICGIRMTREWTNGRADCFTLDHVIPVSRGGNHTLENLRGAHFSCNLSKNDRLLSELADGWVEQRRQAMTALLASACKSI